jgi:hypothetical protein
LLNQPTIDANGTLHFAPEPNAHGTTTITIVLQDDGGTAAGGMDTSLAQTFKITVDKPHPLHNAANPVVVNPVVCPPDVVCNPFPSAEDVLLVINYINARGSGPVAPGTPPGPPYLDVTGDNYIAADDVVTVINWINAHAAQSEAEAAGANDDLLMLVAMDVAGQGKRKV